MSEPVQALTAPGWVWGVFIGLAVAALACLAFAVWLGPQRAVTARAEVAAPPSGPVIPCMPMPADVPLVVSVTEVIGHDVSPVEVAPLPSVPRWRLNASPAAQVADGAGRLAIVIDDMGVDAALSARAMRVLPPEVTLAFLPYGVSTPRMAAEAKAAGHEILAHVPMEPVDHNGVPVDMGPHGLRVEMPADEIDRLVMHNLRGLEDIAIGINNHMGSRFTAWESGMRVVLTVLQREGLLFLDSRTAAPTATGRAAAGLELPVLARDVFLDHVQDAAEVKKELDKAAALAKTRGFAVAIGHPLPVTLDVLEAELPSLAERGVVLVPLSQGVAR